MNNNKFFALAAVSATATVVLPHCAECFVSNRRFSPVEVEEGKVYSDPSSGVFRLELGGFPKPRQKGYNLIKFELSEFSRQQKRKLFCKAA